MKVTTELKNIIKRAFDQKVADLKKATEEIKRQEYESVIKTISDSPEYKAYIEASARFIDLLKAYEIPREQEREHGYTINTYYMVKDITDIVKENRYHLATMEEAKAIAALDGERDALLVKLTYEKDLEKISALLAEYGIIL